MFQEQVKRALDMLPNCYYIKLQQVTRNGDPDLVLSFHGVSIHIELKRKGEKPRLLQRVLLQKHAISGGVSIFLHPDNFPQIYDIMASYDSVRRGSVDDLREHFLNSEKVSLKDGIFE